MELLETIAGGIAALFESAQLSENLEVTRREIEVTDEVARIITSTLDIEAAYGEFWAVDGMTWTLPMSPPGRRCPVTPW